MAIFNSLGSNYDSGSFLEAFSASNSEVNSLRLQSFLEQRYGGHAMLFYKGREAIRVALRATKLQNADVAICGFTCFAVYDAVVSEGFGVTYVDIDDSLNFSLEQLKDAVKANPKIKVVMVQNTLGYPADGVKIAKYCKEKDLVLIEDLAHCIGATYAHGEDAGTIGDFTVLSFSQDKMIDGISGGAVVVRNKKFSLPSVQRKPIDFNRQRVDRAYPFHTVLIRNLYHVGIGKVLHRVLRQTNQLSKPMDGAEKALHALPHWYAYLIYQDFRDIAKYIAHRKTIAKVYAGHIDKRFLIKPITDSIDHSANLRFPIFVKDRDALIRLLKSKQIHVSDIWYDAPIGPKKYLVKTNYTGQCPNAEKISEKILNLPTHKNVTEKDALLIAETINKWLA